MKNLSNIRIDLFESTIAKFKLSINAILVSVKKDNTLSPLVYVSNRGNAVLNPNVYLVFTYREEGQRGVDVYTSFPQIYPIRAALEATRVKLYDPETFYESPDGSLEVKPNVSHEVIQNVGRDKANITFSIITFTSTEDPTRKEPGVAVHLSTSEYASILTVEEFLTIYTIVNEVNLTHLKAELGMYYSMYNEELMSDGQSKTNQKTYQPKQQYSVEQAIPTRGTPSYGGAGFTRGSQPRPGYTTQPKPQYERNLPGREMEDAEYLAPTTPTPKAPTQPQPKIQPRENTGMLMKNIQETTPVTHINLNDENLEAKIDELFSDED